jgi:hypothetical protein
MGEVNLASDDEDDLDFEKGIVREPDFFVVDDLYNFHDRLSLVECDWKLISVDLIYSLAEMCQRFPDWKVKLSLGDSGLFVGENAVLVGGRRFWNCSTVEEVADRCRRPIDYGPPPVFSQAMFELWSKMIAGDLDFFRDVPPLEERQWVEAVRVLEVWARSRPTKSLNEFDYGAVRYDLHPATRCQFVTHAVAALGRLSSDFLKKAKRNIEQDAADALSGAVDEVYAAEFASSITKAQSEVASKLGRKEAALWWPNILAKATQSAGAAVRKVLIEEQKSRFGHSDSSLQLSALFSLALLRADELKAAVDAGFDPILSG